MAKGLEVCRAQGLTNHLVHHFTTTCKAYTHNTTLFQVTYKIVMKLASRLVGNQMQGYWLGMPHMI
jgi:hypothetical protein